MQINNSIADLKSHSKQELVKKCDKVGQLSDLDAKKTEATSIGYCVLYTALAFMKSALKV